MWAVELHTVVTIVIEIGKMMERGIASVQSPVFHPEMSV